ncbi:acyl-CoA N-acyltransferase [Xylaria arbuscula]|nr:acyl-CoA N-acyltransferase [Xylaria arbuscula]
MAFEFVKVHPGDAGSLMRYVDSPAIPSMLATDQQETVIQWYIATLEQALEKEHENFYQIHAPDGTPVGFCGWTFDQAQPPKAEASRPRPRREHDLLPETLNLQSWIQVSASLRTERERVIGRLQNVCRLTFMMVHPDYQRQGLGSLLLKCLCEEFERSLRLSFVMASPAGVRLYTKFGFRIMGVVSSQEGQFTSMLRQPQGI